MAKSDEDSERAVANMARAARKVGPNDRVVELRKVGIGHSRFALVARGFRAHTWAD